MEVASDSPETLHDTAWAQAQEGGGPKDKASSVMEPYVRGMRYLKVIGLPVRISVKDRGVVTFSDRFRRTKCGIKVALILGIFLLPYILFYFLYDLSFVGVMAAAPKYGVGKWDFFGYVAYPTSTVFAAVAHTFSFKGMGAALTEFAGTYTKHPSLQTGQESAVYNRVWWRIITLNLIVFPVSLCLGSFDAFYFLHEELPSSFHPFYGVIGLIQGYIFSLPSTSLAIFELMLFCIGILNQSLQKYYTFLQGTLQQGSQNGHVASDMDRIMQDGFGISKLVVMADDMFGAPTTVIYAYRLFSLCIAMFFATGLFKILDGGLSFDLLLPGYAFVSVILVATLLYSVAGVGHNLATSYRRVKNALQKIKIHKIEEMSPKEEIELDVLIDKFSKHSPFRPLDMFDANFATLASLAGLAFTYVIVLLQFKIGDS